MKIITKIYVVIAVLKLFLVFVYTAYAATHTYDDLNRLVQVTYTSGQVINYSYDPAGNILDITSSGGSNSLDRAQ